jgi:hypothetical protein
MRVRDLRFERSILVRGASSDSVRSVFPPQVPNLVVLAYIAAFVMLFGAGPVAAQELAPPRTVEAREALAAGPWRDIEDGLAVLQAITPGGATLTAFRIAPERFAFAFATQAQAKGERVDVFGPREGAAIAVNGGFFAEQQASGALFPVGLLRLAGKQLSAPWRATGGYLLLADGVPSIRPAATPPPSSVADVLQSKPLLIEPGGKWAMNSNQGLMRQRTVVCLTAKREAILLIVAGAGLSLFEAGWLMRGAEVGGFFACDSALALDGGGSTQLWVAGSRELALRGETPVHNALIVRRRDSVLPDNSQRSELPQGE